MKVQIDKKDLLSLLSRAQNIVEKRNAMPILVNALLETGDGSLKVFATDLEVSLNDELPAQVFAPGRIAVNAKNLFEIAKELDDGVVDLLRKENNWLEIKQSRSVFNIVGISPEEFPVFPSYSTQEFLKVESKTLAEMIEKTIYSVSTDETRYHLNGVYFEKHKIEDKDFYRMVATDGHRLSIVDRSVDLLEAQLPLQGVIIPRKGLQEIRKLLDQVDGVVEMAIEGPQLIVRYKNTILMVRLIEGKYPNYKKLIPQKLGRQVSVKREALLSSLKRVSLISNQKSKGVTFSLSDGKMEITSTNPELGDAKEEIEVEYTGENLKIGFNAKYILDILNSIDESDVGLELDGQLAPGLIRPALDTGYTCVVMPMRI
jgi:DNA polymerase III subunit beta